MITCTTQKQVKKENTKTVFITIKETIETISKEQYNNLTCADTLKFFRRLGGSESVIREYTCDGYNITKSISTSPSKEERTIRIFKFKSE